MAEKSWDASSSDDDDDGVNQKLSNGVAKSNDQPPPVGVRIKRSSRISESAEEKIEDELSEKPAETPAGEDSGSGSSDDEREAAASVSPSSVAELDSEGWSEPPIQVDLQNMPVDEALTHYCYDYEDCSPEFADVEVFMISMDSLLLELTASNCHNWTLGGQTIVLTHMVDQFLGRLTEKGGKFKLVWFSDFEKFYLADPILDFVRQVLRKHLEQQGRYSEEIITFENCLTDAWVQFLYENTPSFMLLSAEDPSTRVFKLSIGGVIASKIGPNSKVCLQNYDDYAQRVWKGNAKEGQLVEDASGQAANDNSTSALQSACEADTLPEFWSQIVKVNLLTQREMDKDRFDALGCAVLISVLIAEKRGVSRSYLQRNQPNEAKVDLIKGRRLLLTSACEAMRLSSPKDRLKFPVADCWDGSMVKCIFDAIVNNELVLPYRLQDLFCELHLKTGLLKPLGTDNSDALLDQPSTGQPLMQAAHSHLLPIDVPLFNEFAPEMAALIKQHSGSNPPSDAAAFIKRTGWDNLEREAEEDCLKVIQVTQSREDHRQKRQRIRLQENRRKQKLSAWYEFFAQSLEGRGTGLLVDFARAPRGLAPIVDQDALSSENTPANSAPGTPKQKQKQPHQHQHHNKGKGGGGKKKEMSNKEKIIANNLNDPKKKQIKMDGEKQQIAFAVSQKSMRPLEELMQKLELTETRASCAFEQANLLVKTLQAEKIATLHERRTRAVPVVHKIKRLFVDHWTTLDDRQKDRINEWWSQLGFQARARKQEANDRLYLDMPLVDYQLAYAGEIVDILADPQPDPRVTGFKPDGWQRKLLNVVDRNESALIIAPTSAGKTFVSYYCIEKVLRQNDEDVVVYVSPTKALVNQVAGSIYARFRNKPLTGGKALFGVFTRDIHENVITSQVLITVPQCLEILLMSSDSRAMEWRSRIKYVIFDEVHCIGSSEMAEMSGVTWERALQMIPSPFLALSATIGNPDAFFKWLEVCDSAKFDRHTVRLIKYDERYSELEMQIQEFNPTSDDNSVRKLNPFSVYSLDKIRLFGIPADQLLTATQIYDLFQSMALCDDDIKSKLSPAEFFGDKTHEQDNGKIWLSRQSLRAYESALKARFMVWVEHDKAKARRVVANLGTDVQTELAVRSQPMDKIAAAMQHIVPLIEHLRTERLLPAICFNDNRRLCENLAKILHDHLAEEERRYKDTADFQSKFAVKNEDKLTKEFEKQQSRAISKKVTKGNVYVDERGNKVKEMDDTAPTDAAGTNPLDELKRKAAKELEKFRLSGVGTDQELYEKVINRLKKHASFKSDDGLLHLLDRGIGYHHSGMAKVPRESVEILFRSGHLAVVFATSTLALGINMPCKTVIFGTDSPYLTPLQFRQMSGRAGRRGFDNAGNVVLMALPTSKIRRLLTASLSNLRGNVPLNASFVLRLMGILRQNGNADKRQILSLLRNPFLKYSSPEKAAFVDKQQRSMLAFSLQLLRHLDLLNESGRPTGLMQIVNKLHYHEPGNLLFIYLLQKGAFHDLCRGSVSTRELKETLCLIMAHLFTARPIPIQFKKEKLRKTFHNSKVFMDPLPASFDKHIAAYNEKVNLLFKSFLQATSATGLLQGSTFALARRSDADIDLVSKDVVKPLDSSIIYDKQFMPAFPYPPIDSRGRKIELNSYAYDYYIHGIRWDLQLDNRIMEGDCWQLINDFSVCLRTISETLDVIGRRDKFVMTMKELAVEYQDKFHKGFGMKAVYRQNL